MKKVSMSVGVLLVGVILFSCIYLCFGVDVLQSTVGKQSKSQLTLFTLSGKRVSLSKFEGQKVILFFWTTWCPHCRQALSDFAEEYPQLQESGIELVSIDIGESAVKVSSFVKRKRLPYQTLLDRNSSVAKSYGVRGVPSVRLLSQSGQVIYSGSSLPSNYKQIFEK